MIKQDLIKVYMEDFTENAKQLAKTGGKDLPPLHVREAETDRLVEEHFELTGRLPQSYALSRLADYLLAGHLKDRDIDKVTNTEYPVLSHHQLYRRGRSQVAMESDTMDFLESKITKRMDSLAMKRVKKAEY